MTTLPNPFDSGATDCPPEEAATPLRQEDVAVEYVDQTDCIAEIFIGARKLDAPRFIFDEERFMIDIEELPLFLRRA